MLFYIRSLNKLEKVLSKDDMNLVLDMWRIILKKATQNFAKYFDDVEVVGEVFYFGEESNSIVFDTQKSKGKMSSMV